jgi:hypothetical protein
MPIGLMTGAPGESRFLLEDTSILIFLNFQLPDSLNPRPDCMGG